MGAAIVAGMDAAPVLELPEQVVASLARQVAALQTELTAIRKEILAWHRTSAVSQRLATIPGIGIISATALAASVTDPQQFRSGREFAAWLGLTPLQNSSGGKERMGRISKMGDKYLRRLQVVGMTSLVRRARVNPNCVDPPVRDLLARKPVRLATVAMANRTARIAWVVMACKETYRGPAAMALAA